MPLQKQKVTLQGKWVEYSIRESRRAKKVRFTVYCDASFVVTVPHGFSRQLLPRFIQEKASWILRSIEYFRSHHVVGAEAHQIGLTMSAEREQARAFITGRAEHFSRRFGFAYNHIFVKAHRTKWGSCSHKQNLNFNYRIMYLPQKLADYIVVHELCHLRVMDHSKKFWNLVAKMIPDYTEQRRELKKYVFRVM